MITGLRSDLPGLATAQVTENAYDSATGQFILIPQGEFVAFSALSMVAIQAGATPGILWLLLGLSAVLLVIEGWRHLRGVEVDWRSTLFWAVR